MEYGEFQPNLSYDDKSILEEYIDDFCEKGIHLLCNTGTDATEEIFALAKGLVDRVESSPDLKEEAFKFLAHEMAIIYGQEVVY